MVFEGSRIPGSPGKPVPRKKKERGGRQQPYQKRPKGRTDIKEGKFLNCLLPEGIYADLRNLSVARKQLINKLNSAKNKLVSILDEHFPEFEEVFKNLLGKAALWVLRHWPFPSIILNYTKEELAENLKRAANKRVGSKRAEKLIEAAERSVGVKEELKGAYIRLHFYLDEIEFLIRKEKVDIGMLQDILGHKSLNTTAQYTKPTMEDKKSDRTSL